MRNSGSCRSIGAYKTALQQECALLGVAWLSPGDQLRLASLIKALEKEDLNPLHRKLPLQDPPPASSGHFGQVEPPPPSHAAPPVRGPRRSVPSGGTHLGSHDGGRHLVAGSLSHGSALHTVEDMSHGPGLPGTVPRSPDGQCCLPDERVVGDDGPPDSTDGHPLSEAALRDTL